jgi:hypothetical protein
MIVLIYEIKMYYQKFKKLHHKFDWNYEPKEIKIRNDKILIISKLIKLIRKNMLCQMFEELNLS